MFNMKQCIKGICNVFLSLYANFVVSQYMKTRLKLSPVWISLQQTLLDHHDQNESEWIRKIESIRKEMDTSSIIVKVTDYGAGLPNQTLKGPTNQIEKQVGEISRSASKPYFWSLFLFNLIRAYKPEKCLELGTCLGISALYQASALKLNGSGMIVTLEGSASLAELARDNFKKVGLDNGSVVIGRFQDTLDEVLKKMGKLDYVFIDGHHDEEATIRYFNQILPTLSEGALVVFDDISWSSGMKRAWKKISEGDNVGETINLRCIGLCIISSGQTNKEHFYIPLL